MNDYLIYAIAVTSILLLIHLKALYDLKKANQLFEDITTPEIEKLERFILFSVLLSGWIFIEPVAKKIGYKRIYRKESKFYQAMQRYKRINICLILTILLLFTIKGGSELKMVTAVAALL